MTSVLNTKSLILFDLDGVIIDSRANMEAAWRAVRDATGTSVPFEDYFALIGRAFHDIMSRLGIEAEMAQQAETVFRTASMQNLSLIDFFPGAADALEALAASGKKLGVVTSKDKLRTNAILALLPVDFVTVQTPNQRLRSKPAPDHLMSAMALAQTDPADSLYLGDMDSDYEAAQRAGVDYLHASWGYGARPAPEVPALRAFSELPAFLKVSPS